MHGICCIRDIRDIAYISGIAYTGLYPLGIQAYLALYLAYIAYMGLYRGYSPK